MKKLFNVKDRPTLIKELTVKEENRITLSFYKYWNIANPELFRDHFYLMLDELGVLGRIYVSMEGVNAQVSIPEENLDAFKSALDSIDFLKGIRLNYAIEDDSKSFIKLKIKVRNKIVADGLDDNTFDVTDCGIHLNAVNFNALAEQQGTIIIDMRNHYESEVGKFKGALCPPATTFREALPMAEEMLKGKEESHVIMYCTGGIRCEKASAYFKSKGFNHVYQVEGGIIEYARQAKQAGIENKFIGKNFVFDERLGERISEEIISVCHQCGELCDTHTNCANDLCHILFIQCSNCAEKFQHCCSEECAAFIQLSEDEKVEQKLHKTFNGSKFSKARFQGNTSLSLV